MKKLMNEATSYVEEMLEGYVAAHPSLRRTGESGRVIARTGAGGAKVGVVSGGGSGHLPLFMGYVGNGLLDACSIGNVFEGPTVGSCYDAITVADTGKGVLRLYGNYGGDRMNFDAAGELAEEDGIATTTVLGNDDIASASAEERGKRRGVAGIIYAYKAAGAAADWGGDLTEVTELAQRTVDSTRSIGVALSPCTIPGSAGPSFQLAEDQIEMGMGIHGEPGIWRDTLRPADALVDEMIDRLLAERPAGAGADVSVLVNSLGATPIEELFILYGRAEARLRSAGLRVFLPLVGHFATALEMAGVSVSLCFADSDMKRAFDAPAACPFWRVA